MAELDHNTYEKYLESISYYDVGAFGALQFPFDGGKNLKYLRKYVGIDPFFQNSLTDGKFIYYKCVVSDTEGEKSFYIVSPKISSSLFPTDKEEFGKTCRKKYRCKETKVQCRKLSNIIYENGGDIDILKIDAHGSEYVILKDINKYLNQIASIHVEAWTTHCYQEAFLLDKTHELLTDNSFTPVLMVEPPQLFCLDILYVNNKYSDRDKLDFIKNLYGVSDLTIEVAKKEIEIKLYIIGRKNG